MNGMNLLRNRKGQGTTEYLIILAIVIVIALVVVGVLGGIPNIGGNISENQSKTYWGTVSPLAVIEWSVATSTGSIVFQNQTSNIITVTDLNWSGSGINITDVNIGAGSKATVTDSSITCGVGGGQGYSKQFGYTYNTPNLSGLKFVGSVNLSGKCQ